MSASTAVFRRKEIVTNTKTIGIVAVTLRKHFVVWARCGLSFLLRTGVEIGRPDMDDIVTQLRGWVAVPTKSDYMGRVTEFHEVRGLRIFDEAIAEIERLRAVIDAVDDLHSPRIAHDTCLACGHDWPCPTYQLTIKEARRG
jgi:hypothetical protein